MINPIQALKEKLAASHSGLGFIVPVFVFLAAFTALYWWSLVDSESKLREETLANAELRGRQVNDAISEAVGMLFFNADAALQNLIDFYKQESGKPFGKRANVIIDRFPAGAVMQVAVIGRDGYLEYSNIDSWERVYLGDREHFKVHWKNPTPRLYISKPLMGRVSRQWSIQFSRPIINNGDIQAVMVMSISPVYLDTALRQLAQGEGDVITLFGVTGELMARSKDSENAIGRKLIRNTPYEGAAPGEKGRFTKVSEVDGVSRLYNWSQLSAYPVSVVSGMSVQKTMSSIEAYIQQGRIKALVGTVVIWAATLMAMYLGVRMQSFALKRRELEYAATHDLLTGVGNRQALENHLAHFAALPDSETRRFAILFIDLDGFKAINDEHGHMAGDEVLKVVASRVKGCARNHDLVARLGGDEFIVVYHDADGKLEVASFIERVTAAIEQPMAVDHKLLKVGASIGVARYPEDGKTIDELLASSDRSMYDVKIARKRWSV